MHGPQNNAELNGGHPVLLAAVQCNCDVQLSYHLPITDETRSDLCDGAKGCGSGVAWSSGSESVSRCGGGDQWSLM